MDVPQVMVGVVGVVPCHVLRALGTASRVQQHHSRRQGAQDRLDPCPRGPVKRPQCTRERDVVVAARQRQEIGVVAANLGDARGSGAEETHRPEPQVVGDVTDIRRGRPQELGVSFSTRRAGQAIPISRWHLPDKCHCLARGHMPIKTAGTTGLAVQVSAPSLHDPGCYRPSIGGALISADPVNPAPRLELKRDTPSKNGSGSGDQRAVRLGHNPPSATRNASRNESQPWLQVGRVFDFVVKRPYARSRLRSRPSGHAETSSQAHAHGRGPKPAPI